MKTASLLVAAVLTVASSGMATACEWQKNMAAMSTPHTAEQMTAVEVDSEKVLEELKVAMTTEKCEPGDEACASAE
ncbi:MAG: hypothetical protein ABJO09_04720 [Hyphomicrobiales bacterium]